MYVSMYSEHLKSELVCTVTRRKPDEKTSGFQHVRILDVRFIHLCPVIGQLLYLKRPITGCYIRFSDVRKITNI